MDGICPFAKQIEGVMTYAPGPPKVFSGFVDHTAGGFYTTLSSAAFWNQQGVSVHFAISRKGEVAQICNIFDKPFAQGRLGPKVTWPPYTQLQQETGSSNPNDYGFVSTEHEDAETVGGRTRFIPDAEWTPEQYAADLKVKRWCIEEVKRVTGEDLMQFGLDSLAGHYMFDGVNRAQCPGPAWRNEYRERLFNDLTEEDDMYHQHDAWALQDLIVAPDQRFAIDARKLFGVPPDAKRVSVEFLSKSGYGVVLHGNSQSQAGRIGWARSPQAADGYGECEVELDADGAFYLWSEGANTPISLFVAHCRAWY